MEKLIFELTRLYLPAGAVSPELLARHLLGRETHAMPLVAADGSTRAMAIRFAPAGANPGDLHWTSLCDTANALQSVYGFPAPGVSVCADGSGGFRLWVAFQTPVPAARAQGFLELLHRAHFPDLALEADAVSRPVELPPCMNQDTGRWSAFINPGMGASFVDEPGLEMSPPPAAQAAFLEDLQPVGAPEFERALRMLEGAEQPAQAAPSASSSGDLLLRDATLEDIVRHLHAKHIEPTFRHLIR